MKILLQRVTEARVRIGGEVVGEIQNGFLALVGCRAGDRAEDADRLAVKTTALRVFGDDAGRMNRSVLDVGGDVLAVSQFTLYADCRKRRPGFTEAARPELAVPLYELVISECRSRGFKVETGEFGADMQVASVNDGPVTIILDSNEL